LDQNGHKEEEEKKIREKEKKREKNRRRIQGKIHSFCSLLLFSSVESAHIPTNSTRHVCPLVYVLVYCTITTTIKNNRKKSTERKEVSNKHALGIKIFHHSC
jgi:hypothetical protein